MDEFTKKIIEFLKRENFNKIIPEFNKKYFSKSSVCGDSFTLYILEKDNIVKDISYQNSSCTLNSVCLEILCKEMINKDLSELKRYNYDFFKEKLNFPQSKSHCVEMIFSLEEKKI